MSVKIYNLVSALHNAAAIDKSLENFMEGIESELTDKFEPAPVETAFKDDSPFVIIFIKSGGVENDFKLFFSSLNTHFILIASNMHNSLPAALEISAFINMRGGCVEILHGASEKIGRRLGIIIKAASFKKFLRGVRVGVIGRPSDWLIASQADYNIIRQKFGIEVIDIPIGELLAVNKKRYNIEIDCALKLYESGYDKQKLDDALNLYKSLKILIERYKLSAFTLRCFDLLDAFKDTGCLALAILNDEGITAGCEGDLPALISMMIINGSGAGTSFMANPASFDSEKNTAVFAHCTVPLKMCLSYFFTPHFESGLGVAIRGIIPCGRSTIFKLSPSFDEYRVSAAMSLSNLSHPGLCRTQIEVFIEKGAGYFFTRPLGNHHIIAAGDHCEFIDEFFSKNNK